MLNSRRSGFAELLREGYNDAVAIEMESAGAAQAGHLNRKLPVLVVRGISDRADGTKDTLQDNVWQQVAAEHAAAFAITLISALGR